MYVSIGILQTSYLSCVTLCYNSCSNLTRLWKILRNLQTNSCLRNWALRFSTVKRQRGEQAKHVFRNHLSSAFTPGTVTTKKTDLWPFRLDLWLLGFNSCTELSANPWRWHNSVTFRGRSETTLKRFDEYYSRMNGWPTLSFLLYIWVVTRNRAK